MNIRWLLPAALAVCTALAGCSGAESDWRSATQANTLGAYQAFLQNHPGSKHADNAQGRILALQDERTWTAAHATNTIAAYQNYLQTESGGVHVGEAQFQEKALQRAQDWKSISGDPSSAQLEAFLLKYPQGLEADEARAKLKDLTYRVQLADSRSQAEAERKRARLAARFGKVIHQVVVEAPKSPDTEFRVTSGPMSQAAAASLCATLEHEHQSCKLFQAG